MCKINYPLTYLSFVSEVVISSTRLSLIGFMSLTYWILIQLTWYHLMPNTFLLVSLYLISNLTPMKVEMRRIIPVSQASVHLTNATCGSNSLWEPSVSTNQRADGREVYITFNSLLDSVGGVPWKKMTPTIWPVI